MTVAASASSLTDEVMARTDSLPSPMLVGVCLFMCEWVCGIQCVLYAGIALEFKPHL